MSIYIYFVFTKTIFISINIKLDTAGSLSSCLVYHDLIL